MSRFHLIPLAKSGPNHSSALNFRYSSLSPTLSTSVKLGQAEEKRRTRASPSRERTPLASLGVNPIIVYGRPDGDRRAGKGGGAARHPVHRDSRHNALSRDVDGSRPSSGRGARGDQRGRDRDRRL